MRVRILLGALVVMALWAPSFLHERFVWPISFRQMVDLEIMNLGRNLEKAVDGCDRKVLIEKTRKNVVILKTRSAAQIKADETFFKQQILSLEKQSMDEICGPSGVDSGLASR
jgi:hypothetical protein